MTQLAPKPPPQIFRERRGVPAEKPMRVAHIVSVSGSRAVAILEYTSEGEAKGKDARINVGAAVKIITPVSMVVGLVSAVSAPMPEFDGKKEEIGLIEINLAGEMRIDE